MEFVSFFTLNVDSFAITTNGDLPVGRVGTTLGDHEINIAEYNLARSESGGTAMAIITIDSPLSTDALTALRVMPPIKEVRQLRV